MWGVRGMRLFNGLVCLGVLLVSFTAQAEKGEFDLGIAVGSPNGFIAKYWTSERTAIDIFGEWSFDSNEYKMHADVLYHDFDKIKLDDARIAFYYGGGIRITFAEKSDDSEYGLRIPFGLNYFFSDVPVDTFGELAPRVNVYPSTNVGMDVLIGIRYRFNVKRE